MPVRMSHSLTVRPARPKAISDRASITFIHGARMVSDGDPGNLDYNALEFETLKSGRA